MASSDPVQKVTSNKEPPESEELRCEEAAWKIKFFSPCLFMKYFIKQFPLQPRMFIHTSHFLYLKQAKTLKCINKMPPRFYGHGGGNCPNRLFNECISSYFFLKPPSMHLSFSFAIQSAAPLSTLVLFRFKWPFFPFWLLSYLHPIIGRDGQKTKIACQDLKIYFKNQPQMGPENI